MISFLGDRNGDAPGGFLLFNENFDIVSKYGDEDSKNLVSFSYDFWYQPYHNSLY
jgi:selenium-binding protein 1